MIKEIVLSDIDINSDEKQFLELLITKLGIKIYAIEDIESLQLDQDIQYFIGVKIKKTNVVQIIIKSEKSVDFSPNLTTLKRVKKIYIKSIQNEHIEI